MSDELSMGSFTKFDSIWENVRVIQCGSLCEKMGGLKRFSRICSEVDVEL